MDAFFIVVAAALWVAGFVAVATKADVRGADRRALAARLGGTGNRVIRLERDHVLMRLTFPEKELDAHVHVHALWAVGSGPDFAVPSTSRGYAGTLVTFEGLELDPRFPCTVSPAAGAWQVRGALTREVRSALFALPNVHLQGDGRRLKLRWRGDGRNVERLEQVVEHLVALASFGLAPLKVAETLPQAEVHWPSGDRYRRSSPKAYFPGVAGIAKLHFARHRWRLTGPARPSWPTFEVEIQAGRPVGGWPEAVPRTLTRALAATENATIVLDGTELEVAFVLLPDRAALEAGLRLLAEAARPPSDGAFR